MLDLAAGTGKLTRQLVPRFTRVIAVEPLGGMRAELERVVPGAEALVGTAESIPLDDDGVDAVFVAEAFHWFGTSAALDEIARVLRPGGTLAVLFNERDGELDPPLTQAVRETLTSSRSRSRLRHGLERAVANALSGAVRTAQRGAVPEYGRARPRWLARIHRLVERGRRPAR